MTDKAVDLDQHRGIMAQKATQLRRLLAEVAANNDALRARQQGLEVHLLAVPALSWPDAAEKARYLLELRIGHGRAGCSTHHPVCPAGRAPFALCRADA